MPEVPQLNGDLARSVADRGDEVPVYAQEGEERDGEGYPADDLRRPDHAVGDGHCRVGGEMVDRGGVGLCEWKCDRGAGSEMRSEDEG